MAYQSKIEYGAYQGGKLTKSAVETTTKNTMDEVRDRLFELIRLDYPDVTIQDVTYQRKELETGFWKIEAEHETLTLLLKISLL